jgi:hypothetical protein
MRRPSDTVLAVLAAAALVAGCGSDDKSTSSATGTSAAGGSSKAKTSAKAAAPKRASTRGKMVKCLRDAGFDVAAAGGDEETATTYTVKGAGAGSRKAVIVIHSDKGGATSAATKAGAEKGLNAVAFGRAEFIRYKSTNTEAGVIANCVAEGYVH